MTASASSLALQTVLTSSAEVTDVAALAELAVRAKPVTVSASAFLPVLRTAEASSAVVMDAAAPAETASQVRFAAVTTSASSPARPTAPTRSAAATSAEAPAGTAAVEKPVTVPASVLPQRRRRRKKVRHCKKTTAATCTTTTRTGKSILTIPTALVMLSQPVFSTSIMPEATSSSCVRVQTNSSTSLLPKP